MIGRAEELDHLRELYDSLEQGAKAVLVGGDAGIGKSRLIQAFTEGLDPQATAILVGAGTPLAAEVPYAPFAEALRRLYDRIGADEIRTLAGWGAGELISILPAIGASQPAAATSGPLSQTRLFEAFLALITALARRSVVVLVIEDLQWVDASSRGLLAFLVRNLGQEPVLILASYRPDEVHRDPELRRILVELGRRSGVHRLDFDPLGANEIREHLETISGGAVSTDLAQRIVGRAAGNPFFAEQLLQEGGTGAMPLTVRELLTERLARAPRDVIEALRVASITPGTIDDALVAAVLGINMQAAADALRAAVEERLLDSIDDGERGAYAVSSPLLREFLYQDLAPFERARLHAQVASALSALPLRPGESPLARAFELAVHWLDAGDVNRAVPAVLEAAGAAEAALAWPEAHGLLERALSMMPLTSKSDERRSIGFKPTDLAKQPQAPEADLLRRAAEAASLAGHPARAAELAQRALDLTRPASVDPILFERLGRYLWEAGRRSEAQAVFDEGASAAAGIDPALARLSTTWARLLLIDGDHAQAANVARAGLGAAQRCRDDGAVWSASMTLAASLAKAGQLEEAAALIDDANRSVVASPSRLLARPSRIVDLLGSYADAAAALDRLGRSDEGLAMARRGAEAGRRLGAPTWGGIAGAFAATELIRVGRWDEADEVIETALERPGVPLAEAEVRTARARLRTFRGDLEGAEEDLAAVMELLPSEPPHAAAVAVDIAFAEHAAWRGITHRGREAVVAGLAAAARADDHLASLVLASRGLRLEADAAEVARARRNPSEVTEALERGETLLGLASAAADHLAPLAVMKTRRDAELARAHAEYGRLHGVTDAKGWQNVVALRDELHEPFEGAYARWRIGEALLHGRSERGEAERVLREAYASARTLGATALYDEISALARRARIELETGEDHPGENAEEDPIDRLGLSERELEVLTLLAEGRTNRQIGETLFITEKTAGHHVSNILGKLGVSSRMEAAAVAHRAGVVP